MPTHKRLPSPGHLLLGEITRPHGLRGELRMLLRTDYPERLAGLGQVTIASEIGSADAREWSLEAVRMHQRYALLKLQGIDTREQADTLRRQKVLVAIEDAVPLGEGEFYLYQVIGLRALLEDGTELGTVREVLETGANDVYIIDSPCHGELLLPVTEETVLATDIAAGELRVRLPDGLLPS